jgi:hypothetical protein
LTDPGFDFSVLSEFRERLTTQLAANRLLEVLLEAFKARGLLKARDRQRTDSTRARSVEAVRELNRVEQVGETLRFTLNTLAQVAPEWLKREMPSEWFPHDGRRFDQMHLPKTYACDSSETQFATSGASGRCRPRSVSVDLLVQASHEYEMDLVGPLVHADARHLASARADQL